MASIIEIVFTMIYLPIIITIASFLVYKVIKLKANNVIFLLMFFIVTAVDYLTVFLEFPYEIIAIVTNTSFIFILFFVKYTFYKEKKSSFYNFLLIFIFLRIADFILRIENRFIIPPDQVISAALVPQYYAFLIIVIVNSLMVNGWYFLTSFRMYRSIKNKDIDPWVKKRYLIIAYATVSSMINLSLNFFLPLSGGWYFGSELTIALGIVKLPFVMIFMFGNLIGWIMPGKLKRYFNRNYKKTEDKELSEEEIMDLFKNQLS